MLRPAKIVKFRAIYHRRFHERIIAKLHEEGVIQLKEVKDPEIQRKVVQEEISEISELLARFEEITEILQPRLKEPVIVKERPTRDIAFQARKILEKIEPKIARLREKRDALQKEREEIESGLALIQKIMGLHIPLKYLHSTEEIKIFVGEIPEENLAQFMAEARAALQEKIFISTTPAGKKRMVVIACRLKDSQSILPAIYRFGVELIEVPPMEESPAEAIKKLKKKLSAVLEAENRLAREMGKFRREAREAGIFRELLEIHKERLEAEALMGCTESTVVLEGWVKEKSAPAVERLLRKTAAGRCIVKTLEPEPEEFEAVPVELENPKVVRDFEYITKMYGLPRYDEVDPTPFLSITFSLFFGIALGDAGYGLALAIFMGSGAWLAKIFPKSVRNLMVVSGIFAIAAGILMGGWFGLGRGLWINPIQQPVPLLKLVVFIGIFHLILGYGIVGAIKDAFRRDWKNIAFGRISPVMILLGFFGLSFSILGIGLYEFGINYSFPKTEVFPALAPFLTSYLSLNLFKILFYGGLALGVIGAFATSKGIGSKVGGAINVIYGITSYISDVASYTRLLALGIASGVVAFSINLILGIMYGGIKPLPAPIAIPLTAGLVFIFIAAHSFNIFLSSLGGFIHTMRLHFAEFFGKFYESGGEELSPFKAKRRLTKVKGGEAIGG
ncbi:MAG: V-type ATP synthase subunit I [Candidatus Hadarchaeales archaeon]